MSTNAKEVDSVLKRNDDWHSLLFVFFLLLLFGDLCQKYNTEQHGFVIEGRSVKSDLFIYRVYLMEKMNNDIQIFLFMLT